MTIRTNIDKQESFEILCKPVGVDWFVLMLKEMAPSDLLTSEMIEEFNIDCLLCAKLSRDQYIVQTCCNQEHTGGDCGCRTLAYVSGEANAEQFAKELAEPFNLRVVAC